MPDPYIDDLIATIKRGDAHIIELKAGSEHMRLRIIELLEQSLEQREEIKELNKQRTHCYACEGLGCPGVPK